MLSPKVSRIPALNPKLELTSLQEKGIVIRTNVKFWLITCLKFRKTTLIRTEINHIILFLYCFFFFTDITILRMNAWLGGSFRCRMHFSGLFLIDAKTNITSVIIMAVLISIEKEWRLSGHKPEPGALHAMGNAGPAQSCLVWFQRSTDAICAACPAWCMCALWGTLKKKNNN